MDDLADLARMFRLDLLAPLHGLTTRRGGANFNFELFNSPSCRLISFYCCPALIVVVKFSIFYVYFYAKWRESVLEVL